MLELFLYHEAFIPLPLRHRSFFSRSFLLSLSLSLSLCPLQLFSSASFRLSTAAEPGAGALFFPSLLLLSLFFCLEKAPAAACAVYVHETRNRSFSGTFVRSHTQEPPSRGFQRHQRATKPRETSLIKENKHLPETVEYLASKILLRVCLCESLGRTASRRLFQPVCPPVRIYIRRHRRHV